MIDKDLKSFFCESRCGETWNWHEHEFIHFLFACDTMCENMNNMCWHANAPHTATLSYSDLLSFKFLKVID